MKRKIPIWFITSGIAIIGIILGCFAVYQQRNQVKFNQTTYLGDIKYCEGIQIEMASRDSYFGQNLVVEFEDGLKGKAEFMPLYRQQENYTRGSFDLYIGSIGSPWGDTSSKANGTYIYKIRDYYKNFPIQISIWNNEHIIQTANEENDLLQVEVPEDASISITIESYGNTNSMSVSQEYNGYSIDLPYIKKEGGYYFTIPNLSIERYMKNDGEIKYEGISGILYLDTKKGVWEPGIDEAVTVYAPIEIGSDLNVLVLDLVEASRKGDLSLVVLEEQELYLYYYDGNTKTFLSKSLVGELPTGANIMDFKIIKQDNYLLANYSYSDQKDNQHYVSGVYNYIEEKNQYEVLLSKDYSSELPESFPHITALAIDMYYNEGRLYLMHEEMVEKINLIALDQDKVLYAGTITTSIYEDISIGGRPNEEVETDYYNRYINKKSFIR